MWNPFKNLNRTPVDLQEITNLPTHTKNTAYNLKANKICIRIFKDFNCRESQDVTGDIIWDKDLPLIIFHTPYEGVILYLEDFIYFNKSKDNEPTIEIVPNYPLGLDHRSDLVRHDGIEYHNNEATITILDKSQKEYYMKKYKFYIPVMLNKIPLPIIRLDNADRVLKPVDKEAVKRLTNITQEFLRQWIRLLLLARTGNRKQGIGFEALFFMMMGAILWTIISSFIS